MELKGWNGDLIVTDHSVILKRTAKSFWNMGGFRGNKEIPFRNIVAIQYKKAGFTLGYIQFTIAGGIESRSGVFDANKDENTVTFSRHHNTEFEKARDYIQSMVDQSGNQIAQPSTKLDQLEKLAKLREAGILTEDEFIAEKSRILAS